MILIALVGNAYGWVDIPAGKYLVGAKDHLQRPLRHVRIGKFTISKTEVTNREFAAFVAATKYITDAQRFHNAMVFEPPLREFRWIQDRSAYWRFPNGITRGGIDGKDEHPVTSISVHDAEMYCKWAKVRLPTMDEWEVACRAGTKTTYFFGEDISKVGEYGNIWHGHDHLKADASDGYVTTAPVGSFKPNPWGLYDMYGNVFEFVSGRLNTDRSSRSRHSRGGSWWCSAASCCFFNSVDVGTVDIRASFSNQGFRVAKL